MRGKNTLPQAKKERRNLVVAALCIRDLQGNKCTPISYKLDMNEHHVTADIGIAAWNYYNRTKARLGQATKAYELFQKAYQPNRKQPFGFISEKPRQSSTVFCTGYGGMLQTIIFGLPE